MDGTLLAVINTTDYWKEQWVAGMKRGIETIPVRDPLRQVGFVPRFRNSLRNVPLQYVKRLDEKIWEDDGQ